MEIYKTLKLFSNVRKSISYKKDYLCRPTIGGFESLCLSCFCSLGNNAIPSPEAIAEMSIAYDIFERRNCYMDERAIVEEPTNTIYMKELDKLVTYLNVRYKQKHPNDWNIRINNVENGINYFLRGNQTIETFVFNGEVINHLFDEPIKRIKNASEEDRGIIHKKEIDRIWISTLLLILFEGDRSLGNKIIDDMTDLAMLYQLIEDFANIKRDSRIGKKTMFTTQYDFSFLHRLDYLRKNANKFFSDLDMNNIEKMIIKSGWLIKLLLSSTRGYFSGDRWRDEKNYEKFDKLSTL